MIDRHARDVKVREVASGHVYRGRHDARVLSSGAYSSWLRGRVQFSGVNPPGELWPKSMVMHPRRVPMDLYLSIRSARILRMVSSAGTDGTANALIAKALRQRSAETPSGLVLTICRTFYNGTLSSPHRTSETFGGIPLPTGEGFVRLPRKCRRAPQVLSNYSLSKFPNSMTETAPKQRAESHAFGVSDAFGNFFDTHLARLQ